MGAAACGRNTHNRKCHARVGLFLYGGDLWQLGPSGSGHVFAFGILSGHLFLSIPRSYQTSVGV